MGSFVNCIIVLGSIALGFFLRIVVLLSFLKRKVVKPNRGKNILIVMRDEINGTIDLLALLLFGSFILGELGPSSLDVKVRDVCDEE